MEGVNHVNGVKESEAEFEILIVNATSIPKNCDGYS